MKKVEKIAKQIILVAEDKNKLEKEFNLIKDKQLSSLSLKQLQTILAYEMYSDGAEWNDVKQIWQGQSRVFKTQNSIIDYLENVFEY